MHVVSDGLLKTTWTKKTRKKEFGLGDHETRLCSGDHVGSLKVRRDLVMYGLGIAEGVNNLA